MQNSNKVPQRCHKYMFHRPQNTNSPRDTGNNTMHMSSKVSLLSNFTPSMSTLGLARIETPYNTKSPTHQIIPRLGWWNRIKNWLYYIRIQYSSYYKLDITNFYLHCCILFDAIWIIQQVYVFMWLNGSNYSISNVIKWVTVVEYDTKNL